MTALPMYAIQQRLDEAYKLHPESRTLADFRADERLIRAEREALARANKIVTTHTAIAELFVEDVELLNWETPTRVVSLSTKRPRLNADKPLVVFPAATVGRKGCYELRDALNGLDVKLLALGPVIESPDFWSGIDMEHDASNWLSRADVVVLPAFVEHKPRRLVEAVAAGIPVIASTACGVANVPKIELIVPGDAADLRLKVLNALDLERETTTIEYVTV
jgi:glycosyltransferase involved in cell wall biosynthesis